MLQLEMMELALPSTIFSFYAILVSGNQTGQSINVPLHSIVHVRLGRPKFVIINRLAFQKTNNHFCFLFIQWVLTAAHCTFSYVSYNLGFGSNNLNAPLLSMTSKEAIEHVRYNPQTLNYDIAVIRLPEYIEFTSKIQSVRLPTMNQARAGQFHTTKARVCGFGRTGDGMITVVVQFWI